MLAVTFLASQLHLVDGGKYGCASKGLDDARVVRLDAMARWVVCGFTDLLTVLGRFHVIQNLVRIVEVYFIRLVYFLDKLSRFPKMP